MKHTHMVKSKKNPKSLHPNTVFIHILRAGKEYLYIFRRAGKEYLYVLQGAGKEYLYVFRGAGKEYL